MNNDKYIGEAWTLEEIGLDPEERYELTPQEKSKKTREANVQKKKEEGEARIASGEDKTYNVLSLGAGVQSTCLALMAELGEFDAKIDFAVFADTQAEPQQVYDHLNWLETQVSYPIYRVTKGNLTEDSFEVKTHMKTGNKYVNNLIPMHGILPDGKKTAALLRKCTFDYKVTPILREIKERTEIKWRQNWISVNQWIGISQDELQRQKDSPRKWLANRYPLLERKMTRQHCHDWMEEHGYPKSPRSACYYCTFHNDAEWVNLRDQDPVHWGKAVAFDKRLREAHRRDNENMKMEVFLHRSCKPLSEVDFKPKDKDQMDFESECEGMCGI